MLIAATTIASCGAPSTSTTSANLWTWFSGSDFRNQSGTYGTKGTADNANVPGARYHSISWTDDSDNFWLFGGWALDSNGTQSALNDLWKYDGTDWTWISGSNVVNQSGNYGGKGTAAGTNVPGARQSSISWIDASGNFWLFGGLGYDSAGSTGHLNDLWRFDGTDWTWISGSNVVNQSGIYGEKGTAASTNIPGARHLATSWIDSSGDLWLFGGRDSGNFGMDFLNDLWRFDGTDWTWISGSNVVNQPGVYGTQGAANATNVPGARSGSVSWTDSSGNMWLLSGSMALTAEYSNDLWKFDGADWTWVSGSNAINQSGTYGTQGTADSANVPGARYSSMVWLDASDNPWFFGGFGRDSAGSQGPLNDLWRYQP